MKERHIHKFMACLAVCNCSFDCLLLLMSLSSCPCMCLSSLVCETSWVFKWWWREKRKKYKKRRKKEKRNKRMWKIAIAGKMINWQFLVASIARAHHIKKERFYVASLCDTARGLLHLWVWHGRKRRWWHKRYGKAKRRNFFF